MVDRKREDNTFGDSLFLPLVKNKRQMRPREEGVRTWRLRGGRSLQQHQYPVGTRRGGPQAQYRTAPVPTYHEPPTSSATAAS